MSDNFVKTDAGSVGPFSDIELRELAFAGLLKHDSNIATSPDGDWVSAQNIELFSIQKMPVPHPQGTVIPQFEVQGLPPVFRGPFKLRELFGFAARGMLPPDALIRNDQSDEWQMVHQCAALMSCLNGDLAMLGANGQLVLRTLGDPEKVNLDNTSIPMQLAVQAALKQASLVESQSPAPAIIDEGYEAEQAASHAATAKASAVVTPIASTKNSSNATTNVSEKTPASPSTGDRLRAFLQYELKLSDLLHPSGWSKRAVLFVLASLILIVGVAAYTYNGQLPTQSDHVKGVWFGTQSQASSDQPSVFGISLKDDGKCIVLIPMNLMAGRLLILGKTRFGKYLR